MKCLLTGGSGFLGKALQAELTKQGIPFVAPPHSVFDLADAEVMADYMRENDVCRVIHLAGVVDSSDTKALFDVNIAGVYHLLEACMLAGVKYITFTSSNNVYDMGGGVRRVEDACKPDSRNLYGISKYVGELLIQDYCDRHGMTCAVVRIGDVYGPGQRTGNLVKAAVRCAAEGKPLQQYGSGVRTRDYIEVTDVAKGLLFISERELDGTYNLGTGRGTSAAELLRVVSSFSGCPIEYVDVAKEDTSSLWLDVEPLRQFGFTAQITLAEGLKNCVEEYKKNG